MSEVSEQQFQELFQTKLGSSWERALAIFRNCGANISWDVTNVLLHAIDKNKVEEVISILEQHYEKHLQFQHPEIRGTVSDSFIGINETRTMFLRICQDILELPSPGQKIKGLS